MLAQLIIGRGEFVVGEVASVVVVDVVVVTCVGVRRTIHLAAW